MFKVNDRIQSKADPAKIGEIISVHAKHAGMQYYEVRWNSGNLSIAPECDLALFQKPCEPIDNLLKGNLSKHNHFLRLLIYNKINKRKPINNNIYAFNASRTKLYPYQFKPLLKFMNSKKGRLLICDEVGLGKTIEAGLILIETIARQEIMNTLIVCPSKLADKWKKEMQKRFLLEFEMMKASKFADYVRKCIDGHMQQKVQAIISIESIRSKEIIELLEEVDHTLFQFVVFDEAHNFRNFETNQRKVAKAVSNISDYMLLLTATPIQMRQDDLFSLLNLLDEDEFMDVFTSNSLFDANKPIILAQNSIRAGDMNNALSELKSAQNNEWFKGNKLLNDLMERVGKYQKETKRAGSNLTLREILRDVEELNLMSSIFTRTKKREVHENFPTRSNKTPALEISFSENEMEIYNRISEFVMYEMQTVRRMKNSVVKKWVLNSIQRRMSSCLPAMIRYYKEVTAKISPEDDDDMDTESLEKGITDDGSEYSKNVGTRLKEILNNVPSGFEDTKYKMFKEIIRKIGEEDEKAGKQTKIMVFAFYKATLNYLSDKLKKDGIKNIVLTGDVPMDDRSRLIDEFMNNTDIKVLLSSRVGGEGLDFQFCDAIVNYDMPWNPMELEQRIGRLDRIGQMSPVIRIFNLWIKGTIEERVLKRLYERIRIFEESIGAIEVILGEQCKELEEQMFSSKLNAEEQEQKLQQVLINLDESKKNYGVLEGKISEFMGVDVYFSEEINSIQTKKRYVTPKQIKLFLTEFIKEKAEKSRFVYKDEERIGKIKLGKDFKEIIYSGRYKDKLHKFISSASDIDITFDSDKAFSNDKLEFINILHPLIQSIVDEYSKEDESFQNINAQYFEMDRGLLEKGEYYYFIFLLEENAYRSNYIISGIVIDQHGNPIKPVEESEILIAEMIENGRNPDLMPESVDNENATRAYEIAREHYYEYLHKYRATLEINNEIYLNQKKVSLDTHYSKFINQKAVKLTEAEKKGNKALISRYKNQIENMTIEKNKKMQEIENMRNISLEHKLVCAGMINVI